MGRKTIVWTSQATNKGNLTAVLMDMVKKGIAIERN